MYIRVEDFIEKYGTMSAREKMTVLEFMDMLKSVPAADVIPVEFIDKWYHDHYGLTFDPVAEDWRKYEAGIVCDA